MLIHGGPGRAGGGEEMGGMRGVLHYLQRCAVQGTPDALTAITTIYQYGAHHTDPGFILSGNILKTCMSVKH
jgi:oxepin-CoA hydrolase/3-oxo-5,6-dehydrosuberyl-CoA semialdehyde dehydrogenase